MTLIFSAIFNFLLLNISMMYAVMALRFFQIETMGGGEYIFYTSGGIMVALCIFALTPAGEALFRFLNHLRRPLVREKDIIEPIFANVLRRADIDRDRLDLLVMDDPSSNACAMGRKTIAVTRGAIELPADELEALFAHELGHWKHHDTVLLLIYNMVNLTRIATLWVLAKITYILSWIPILGWITTFLINRYIYVLDLLFRIPIAFGNQFESRWQEYRADKFACEIGYGEGMHRFLNKLFEQDGGRVKIMTQLWSSHPMHVKRLLALEKLRERDSFGEKRSAGLSSKNSLSDKQETAQVE